MSWELPPLLMEELGRIRERRNLHARGWSDESGRTRWSRRHAQLHDQALDGIGLLQLAWLPYLGGGRAGEGGRWTW